VIKIDEHNLTKLYYSIGEVAEMFSVNTSLIRFWEKEFNSIRPKKNKKGNRLFTSKDILKIEKVYYLVKVKGFTLEGAKNEIKKKEPIIYDDPQESDNSALIDRLNGIRQQLLAMKNAN
jgi:DNA-binding transcriptional MerR regulator